MNYFIRDEHKLTPNGRQRLTLWSGQFADFFEGSATELPKKEGFILKMYPSRKRIRVTCPSPRNEENFNAVDEAINAVVNRKLSK